MTTKVRNMGVATCIDLLIFLRYNVLSWSKTILQFHHFH